MKQRAFYALCAVALFAPLCAFAGPDPDTIESLRGEMLRLERQMELLQEKIERLEPAAPAPATAEPAVRQPSHIPQAATLPAPAPASPIASATAQPAWSPSQPITLLGGGANYLNISFDLLVNLGTSTEKDVTELELGDHDPDQRGFSLRNAELALEGAVDPYFKAFSNVVFKLNENNESAFELEEAYALTTSLPWNLQAKAGQFLAEFGRQNTQHPHAWSFVDQPLVSGRLLGGEGLRNVGARVSWLAPTPFYAELMLGVFNGAGETAYSFRNDENTYGRTPADRGVSSLEDLLYVPRVASSFDLTDTQTVIVGASGAFGANDTGDGEDTQIYGADLYWKWRPERAEKGFPFVSWQTEAMVRRLEAGADPTAALPSEVLRDWGLYSQVVWGFRRAWATGLRAEFVSGDRSEFDSLEPKERADRTRVSPNLSWYPTEFSKLRLQYNYDYGQQFGNEHSIWLQTEFLLGAHGAHTF
jgi:hypothetical protein